MNADLPVALVEYVPLELVLKKGAAVVCQQLQLDGNSVLLDLVGDVHGREVEQDGGVLLEQSFVENLGSDLNFGVFLEF